jgi:hypothetical protein
VITATAAVTHTARAAAEFINRERGGIDLMITATFRPISLPSIRAWRNWTTSSIPKVIIMLNQVEQWPLVMQVGDIEIYRNSQR